MIKFNTFIIHILIKEGGDIVIESVCLPVCHLQNRWTESNQYAEGLAYTRGECKRMFTFGPAPMDP